MNGADAPQASGIAPAIMSPAPTRAETSPRIGRRQISDSLWRLIALRPVRAVMSCHVKSFVRGADTEVVYVCPPGAWAGVLSGLSLGDQAAATTLARVAAMSLRSFTPAPPSRLIYVVHE